MAYQTRRKWTSEPTGHVKPDGSDYASGRSHPSYESHEVWNGYSWEDLDTFRSKNAEKQKRTSYSPSVGVLRPAAPKQAVPSTGLGLGGLLFSVLGAIILIPTLIIILMVIAAFAVIFLGIKYLILPAMILAWIPAWWMPISIGIQIWKAKVGILWWREVLVSTGLGALAVGAYFIAPFFDQGQLTTALMASAMACLAASLVTIGIRLVPARIRVRFIYWQPEFITRRLRYLRLRI
jgi:hypothetical protein